MRLVVFHKRLMIKLNVRSKKEPVACETIVLVRRGARFENEKQKYVEN